MTRQGLDIELVLVGVGDLRYPSCDHLTTYAVDEVPPKNIFGRLKRAWEIRRIFGETIDSLGPDDVLYYRYSSPLPLFYPKEYCKHFRTCKIVTEYQTKELDEFKLNKCVLNYWSEFFFGNFLKKQSDAIVGVTDEITQYEVTHAGDSKKPHLTIGNGIVSCSVPVRESLNYSNEEVHILCVANVSRWHGLDRLLRGLAAYNGMPRAILHIAGEGAELPYLQKLTRDLGITECVIFHGFLTGKALDTLFNQCHVAVGSLGIHRIGLKEASVLKAREYCARGIPFIYGISDPDFPSDFPYILHLSADENPVDIKVVLDFTKKVCADSDHPKKMRRYAEEHLDWSVKMKKLKDFLEALVGEKEDANAPKIGSTSPIPTTKN